MQQGEADGHSFAMGCSTSNRVAVAQLPSEELQKNQEAKNQVTSASIARTGAVTSWDGAAWPAGPSENGSNVEDKAREGDSPEEFAERFTPSQKRSNAQSTDALLTSEFISQSRPLQETERQKSSDILEELRMQGIIRSQGTIVRTEEVSENKLQTPHLPFYLPSNDVQLQYRTTLLLNHRPGFSASFSLIRLVLNHYREEQELSS
ncbi:stathmin domain-containing protein 1 isoform X3 [Oxyura jamaicensis]|uniref:stathmin domain-containing protein 1 isoform X3 n=1 Tax=Oxyura jamaicensis TaxID=8884 RepID=UPI0015A64F4D|nr:stathmin domain-containing protein 1 isoform X3 [Oxyura jamaicensis]